MAAGAEAAGCEGGWQQEQKQQDVKEDGSRSRSPTRRSCNTHSFLEKKGVTESA
jgi:hypothetical protein